MQVLRVSADMALGIGAAVWMLAPWAFRVLYSVTWTACSDMARAMVPMLMMRLVTSAIAGTMQLSGHQCQELASQVCMAFVVLLAGSICRFSGEHAGHGECKLLAALWHGMVLRGKSGGRGQGEEGLRRT